MDKRGREQLFSGRHIQEATYTNLSWTPYNNLNGDPLADQDTFNIYIPDECGYIKPESRSELSIGLFHKLCYALTHDEWTYHMLIAKIAFMFKHPELPDQSVYVIKGQQGGTGKDTLMKLLRKVFHRTDGKRYGDNVSLSGYLGDKTENQVREQIFVWFNETTGKEGHKYIELLKEATTKDYLDKRAKFEKSIQICNCVRIFLLSNTNSPLPPDRRVSLCQVRSEKGSLVTDQEFRDIYTKVMTDRHELDSLFSYLVDYQTPEDIVEKYSPENNPSVKVQSFPYDGKFDYKQSPSELQQENEEKCCFPIDKFLFNLANDDISVWAPRINHIYGEIIQESKGGKRLIIQKKSLIKLLRQYIEGDFKKGCQIDEDLSEDEEDYSVVQNKTDLSSKCKDWVTKWAIEYYDHFNKNGEYKDNKGKRFQRCMDINLTELTETYKNQGKVNGEKL